jgi:hypothetical protein
MYRIWPIGGYASVWTETALLMHTYYTYSQGWEGQTLFYAEGQGVLVLVGNNLKLAKV